MNEYIEFKEEYPFVEWNNQFLMEYSIFCESDDNLTDDIEESAPGLYEQWLKLHDYDPKTNTISTGINRVNVGKIGSNKERNRLNQFLKKNDFDPKTGTYRSDIKLHNGQYARVPLNIGVDLRTADGRSNLSGGAASFRYMSDKFPSHEKAEHDELESSIQYDVDSIKELNTGIKRLKSQLSDPELSDDKRRFKTELLKDLYDDKKYFTDKLKNKNQPPYSKRQQDYLTDNSNITLSKKIAFSKPRQSFNVLKHEEGHADDFMNDRSINQDVEWNNINNITPYKSNTRTNFYLLSDHDAESDERYADIYSAKHNPYVKSSNDAFNTTVEDLNHINRTNVYSNIRKGKKLLKDFKKQDEVPHDTVYGLNKAIASGRRKMATKNDMTNYARADMLKAHLDADPEFQKTESPYHSKTNKERSQERKERGELPRKQKKQAKKQNVVKEYMI